MDYVQAIDSLSPEMFQRLQRAVELGKWPDGRVLTPEQRANAMQAIIAWSERHLDASQRIGFINKQPDADPPCDLPQETLQDQPQEQPLNWVE